MLQMAENFAICSKILMCLMMKPKSLSFCMLKYWLKHTRKVLYITMLYGKEHFKFRVSLWVDPIIKEVKRVKATVIEGVEAVYSLNTISDEHRPFCGGSSRMEIMNITLWVKLAFKIHSFSTTVTETLGIQ